MVKAMYSVNESHTISTSSVGSIASAMANDVAARKGVSKSWKITDFEIAKTLGSGQFGRVYLAREKRTEFIVALKTLRKNEMNSARCQHQIVREIEIQTHLKHPYILELYGYFWDDKRIYLILEYATGGEMFSILQKQVHRRFHPKKAARYILQVAKALEYCHTKNVMHRDIKPENLLLDSHDNVKLADFGWSVHAPSDRRRTRCGTVDYLPPEMVETKTYSKTVDHWCLGILTFEFSTGSPPFESSNEASTFQLIKECKVNYPSYMETGAIDLVSKLVQYNPSARISFKDVMEHPWIVSKLD